MSERIPRAVPLTAFLILAFAGGCGERPAADMSEGRTPTPTQTRAQETPVADRNPVVAVETSKGTIKIELDAERAPITVENVLRYADEKFYDGTVFHRVIPTFMIQGGGLTPDLRTKPTHAPITNEAANGLKNLRGTVAMARTSRVHSATAQFFINVVDNHSLDHREETPQGYGYCVFGRVIEGMGVVDAIRNVPTGARGGMQDVPKETVLINSVRRLPQE